MLRCGSIWATTHRNPDMKSMSTDSPECPENTADSGVGASVLEDDSTIEELMEDFGQAGDGRSVPRPSGYLDDRVSADLEGPTNVLIPPELLFPDNGLEDGDS